MIIWWRGAGPLVFCSVVFYAIVMNIVTGKLFHNDSYSQEQGWPFPVALILSGTTCWFLGQYLHGRGEKVLIDKATGKEVKIKPVHDLFSIKIEYWGLVLIVVGGILLLKPLLG